MDTVFLPVVQEAEKRDALERVIAARAFHRSDQLKSLLRFICEAEISGRESLDEYTVAVEALGRSKDYSSLEDGAVRNRIHSLRQRLELYYQTAEDPVRIVLPKGTYCPSFERNPPRKSVPIVLEPIPSPSTGEAQTYPERPVKLVAAFGCFLFALLLAAGVYYKLRSDGVPGIIAEAWGPLVEVNSNPVIYIAAQQQLTFTQRPYSNSNQPNVSASVLHDYAAALGITETKPGYLIRSLNSPFWGDVAGAFAVAEVLGRAGIHPEILPDSAIQMPALNNRNVLLFGRPSFSKIIDLYLRDKPFRLPVPDQHQAPVILNVSPKPGEQAQFDQKLASLEANRETTFGLITVMSSADRKSRIVVFSGVYSSGAQAASEFFSSPAHLQELRRLFEGEHMNGFPASYQVVVRSNTFGTSALDVHYVTHRVIPARN